LAYLEHQSGGSTELKEISPDTSLFDLTEKYPELIEILVSMGFAGVANPTLRQTHGKKMTIKSGLEMLGKDQSEIAATLKDKGFTLI
jgi:hypothetical protein